MKTKKRHKTFKDSDAACRFAWNILQPNYRPKLAEDAEGNRKAALQGDGKGGVTVTWEETV